MTAINIRVDEKLKKESERIFEEIGLSMTSALTIFLKSVVRNQGIPFALEVPNKDTIEAFREADDIASGKLKSKKYKNVSDLRKDLGV